MSIDYEPYPNSKGEDVNTPAVSKLPKVQPPDFSKIKGHACTKIPSFFERKVRFEGLSGSYYRTKKDGTYDGVLFDPSKHASSTKTVMENGQKLIVPFYNYGIGFRNIDIEFDNKNNVLTLTCKIVFVPKKVINKIDNKEYPYENQLSSKPLYIIESRNVTKEMIQFIQERQNKMNELLNYADYYFAPSDCSGCTCFVPVVLKMLMEVEEKEGAWPSQGSSVNYVNLYPSAKRADAANWGEVELKDEEHTPQSQPYFKNGDIIVPPSGPSVKVERGMDSTAVFLLEASHLFGFPNEYFENGGAVHKRYIDPVIQKVDIKISEPQNEWKRCINGQLMSSPVPGKMPIIPPYYYEEFRKYFEKKTGVKWMIKKL